MSQQTFVNGNKYSFTSLDIRINGLSFPGSPFRALNYTAKKDRPKVFGNNVRPVGRTRGQLDCSGSLEMLVSEFDDLMELISLEIPTITIAGLLDAEMTITVTYQENEGQDFRTDTLIGVGFTNFAIDSTQGTEPTTVKIDLSVMDIIWNGLPNVGTTIGATQILL